MSIRAPWIRSQLVLAVLVLWDSTALYLAYNSVYGLKFGQWPGTNQAVFVLVFAWIVSSYLIGRYSITEKRDSYEMVFKGMCVCLVILSIFVGHSWLFNVVNAETRFKGFLLPILVGALGVSFIGQLMIPYLLYPRQKWVIICSSFERSIIEKELQFCSEAFTYDVTFKRVAAELSRELASESTSYVVGWESRSCGIDVGQVESLLRLRTEGRVVQSLVNWCENTLHRIPPELISNTWLIRAEGFKLKSGGVTMRVKRVGDLLGGIALIVITLPLLMLSCLAVWIEDRGPVFYRQKRAGMYGQEITIVKIRSMRVDAENGGAQWSRVGDPRITRVGRIIRALRIDELPQLVSVVKGDLSLIGPRPERQEFEESLKKEIPHYVVRHWVKPGLSGWAQVCYPYGASKEDSRMKLSYDLYYLRNANILLDLLILFKTIRLVAGARGASPRVER